MSEEKKDEKIEEKETPPESSTDKTTEETVTEDEKKSEESTIPKKRFDEVNAKYKDLKEQVATLTSEKKEEPKKETITPDSESDWKQLMEFTVENSDLGKEQLQVVKRLFKSGVSLDKVLEDPLYVAFSESYAKKKVEDDSTPDSNRSPKTKPEKPVSEMTDEEHKEWALELIGKK